MAADENTEVEEKKETKEVKKSGNKMKMIIIVGASIILLSGASYVGWKKFIKKNDIPAENEKIEKEKVIIKILHEMKPFIVNLVGNQGKRYLKAKIDIEICSEEINKEITERDSEIRDSILLLLASKAYDDISNPEGKIELRKELIARINTLLKTGEVQALYFTEFVVQ